MTMSEIEGERLLHAKSTHLDVDDDTNTTDTDAFVDNDMNVVFPRQSKQRGWHGQERRWSFYRLPSLLDDVLMGIGLFTAVTSGVLVAQTPLVVADAFVSFSVTSVDVALATTAANRLFWIACVVSVLTFVSDASLDISAAQQVKRLYEEAARRVLHTPSPNETHVKWLVGPDVKDTADRLQQAMGQQLSDLVRSATRVVVALILVIRFGGLGILYLAVAGGAFATVALGVLEYVLISYWGIQKPETTNTTTYDDDRQQLKETVIRQPVEQIQTVAALNAYDKVLALAKALWQEDDNKKIPESNYRFLRVACVYAYAMFMIGIVLWTNPWTEETFANRLSTVLLIPIVIVSAAQTVTTFNTLEKVRKILQTQLFSILDTLPMVKVSGRTSADCLGAIEFKDVSCQVNEGILEDYNQRVAAGATLEQEYSYFSDRQGDKKRVNLGQHKWSSLTFLLQRFVNLQSGEITLDGEDIDDLNVQWLRQQIAVIDPCPVLFQSLSIYENIGLGGHNITRGQAIAAAKKAQVHDVIMSLPQQYDTVIGDLPPKRFSYHERLLLVIARAIARNPKILVLDHVTSSKTSVVQTVLKELIDTIQVTKLVLTEDGVEPDDESTVSSPSKESSNTNKDAVVMEEINPTTQSLLSTGQLLRLSIPPAKMVSVSVLGALVCGIAIVWFMTTLSNLLSSIIQQYGVWQASQDEADKTKLSLMTSLPFPPLFFCWIVGIVFLAFIPYLTFGSMQLKTIHHVRELYLRALLRQDIDNVDSLVLPSLSNDFYNLTDRVGKMWEPTSVSICLVVSVLLTSIVVAIGSSGSSPLWIAVLVVLGTRNGVEWVVSESAIVPATSSIGLRTTEFFDHPDTIVSLGVEDWVLSLYQDELDATISILHKLLKAVAVGIDALVGIASYAIAIAYGAPLVAREELSIHAFFAILMCISVVLGLPSLTLLVGNYTRDFEDARKAGAEITYLLDRRGTIDATRDQGLVPKRTATIEFRNVTFKDPKDRSPTSSGLQCFSTTVEDGQTVVFCGPPDGGHTSIVALLERFYDPLHGEVCWDSINLKQFNVASLRDHIGLVDHEPILFTGGTYSHKVTIEDNIAMGVHPSPPSKKIVSAAKLANAHGFITESSFGYEKKVVERRMSIGRLTCLALARAVVKNPSVLILDDVATKIDADGQKVVDTGVDKVLTATKRTTIIIGHRMPAVRRADRIFVLGKGAIVEQGTHDELLAKDGVYAKLMEKSQSE